MNSEQKQTTRYVGTFKAMTTKGVEHTHRWVIDAVDLEAATEEVKGWMRCYITPPLFPPTLLSVEEMVLP